jgi:hypothetical protein
MNMIVYTDDSYVGMVASCRDKFVCIYVDTDKSMYTRGNKQVRSKNISHE